MTNKQTHTHTHTNTQTKKFRGKHKLSTNFNILMIKVKNVPCQHEIIAVMTHYRSGGNNTFLFILRLYHNKHNIAITHSQGVPCKKLLVPWLLSIAKAYSEQSNG